MNRLPYIDKLKALAMLLVIMGHTFYFCMYHEGDFRNPIFSIICTFHVPLFFFLSGFVINRAPDLHKFFRKARRFLMPMLVVGLINAVLIGRIKDFFLNGGHNGYWYLLTLTIFYMLLIPFQLTNKTSDKAALPTNRRLAVAFLTDCALAVMIWGIIILVRKLPENYLQPFNTWAAFAYWPFFIIGFIFRKYALTDIITSKPWISFSLLLAVYVLLVVTFFKNIDHLPVILDFIIALSAITALIALFYTFNNSTTFMDRQLLLIGNSTLDIYIYHYFFIRFINLEGLEQYGIVVELTVTATLTILIAYGSLAIGKAVRRLLPSASK
jgi:fucose 4-O-acetylase-like acetyltransferase